MNLFIKMTEVKEHVISLILTVGQMLAYLFIFNFFFKIEDILNYSALLLIISNERPNVRAFQQVFPGL